MSKTTSHILSAILRQLKLRPSLDTADIDQYRKLLEKSAGAFKPHKSVKTVPCKIGAMEAQWLLPSHHDATRLILYVHGGGYVAGSITSHQDLASRIAKSSNAKALIFNYRLAPEHPFPQGLNDVETAYKWMTDLFREPCRISLVGDSAGAGLVLALLTCLLEKGLPLPACTVLISPWIDLECKNLSYMENREKDPMLSRENLKKTAHLYTDNALNSPMISPVNGNFSGICPILIQTGENEVLIDDSRILAQKLKQANATFQLEIWPEMFHVWHYFAKYLSEGRQAIDRIGEFIRTYS